GVQTCALPICKPNAWSRLRNNVEISVSPYGKAQSCLRDTRFYKRILKLTRRVFRFVLCSFVALLFFSPHAACLPSDPPSQAQDEAFKKALMALKEDRLDVALEELTTAEREHPFD